jgi:hypothetical protein
MKVVTDDSARQWASNRPYIFQRAEVLLPEPVNQSRKHRGYNPSKDQVSDPIAGAGGLVFINSAYFDLEVSAMSRLVTTGGLFSRGILFADCRHIGLSPLEN